MNEWMPCLENGRISHVEGEPRVLDELSARCSLHLSFGWQRNILPSSEPVLCIPDAFTVPASWLWIGKSYYSPELFSTQEKRAFSSISLPPRYMDIWLKLVRHPTRYKNQLFLLRPTQVAASETASSCICVGRNVAFPSSRIELKNASLVVPESRKQEANSASTRAFCQPIVPTPVQKRNIKTKHNFPTHSNTSSPFVSMCTLINSAKFP